MTDKRRSVVVGLAFALGGLVVAGVAVAVVRVNSRRRPGPESTAERAESAPVTSDRATSDRAASEQPGPEQSVAQQANPVADLPADMRPADPSYGPVF